jgi:hypothetical protein
MQLFQLNRRIINISSHHKCNFFLCCLQLFKFEYKYIMTYGYSFYSTVKCVYFIYWQLYNRMT